MLRPRRAAGVLGIFGGTFDPIHIGHLRTAFELSRVFGIDRTHFVPAAIPPHREPPEAALDLRLAMLEAALTDLPAFIVDSREIDRQGKSYTVDTARSFRREYPDHVICLMLGMDAFLGLPAWRDWETLLDLVNIVVARRPGSRLPDSGVLGLLLAERRVETSAEWALAGQIVVRDVTQLEIAATDLRASIRAGIEPRYLVPDSVARLIAASGCYAD